MARSGDHSDDDENGASDSAVKGDRQRSAPSLILASTTGHRASLVAVASLAFVGGLTEAAVLVIVARLAVAVAAGDSVVHVSIGPVWNANVSVPTLVAIAAVLVVVRVALQLVQVSRSGALYESVWNAVRDRIVSGFINAAWALQAEEREGRLQELVTTYAGWIANSVASLSQALVAFFSLIAFLATALFVNVVAAVVVVAAATVVALMLRPMRNVVRNQSRRTAAANMSFATDVTELAAGMQEVRVFNVEHHVLKRIRDRIVETGRLSRRMYFVSGVVPTVYQGAALLLIVGSIGVIYASGTTRLASLGGVVLIMIRSLSYGQQLQSNYQSMHAAAPYFETLADEHARASAAAVDRSGATVGRIGSLAFDDVGFEYVTGRPVIQGATFELRPGEIVGIIGPSGAGKSTLVQMLLRLREPTTGRVLVNGSDAREIAIPNWYERVSFVPQDVHLIAGTVAENIRFYREDLDSSDVERASKLANFHDDVVAMTDGYESAVGERGRRLSGGQRQRLSIARALAERPDLLVLDEPTSSLDVQSEALIRETLRELSGETTVVIIAHRLSTLDICDRIMVVDHGRIQGLDTPSNLERTTTFYQEALRLSGLR